jgi:hypothetical protein
VWFSVCYMCAQLSSPQLPGGSTVFSSLLHPVCAHTCHNALLRYRNLDHNTHAGSHTRGLGPSGERRHTFCASHLAKETDCKHTHCTVVPLFCVYMHTRTALHCTHPALHCTHPHHRIGPDAGPPQKVPVLGAPGNKSPMPIPAPLQRYLLYLLSSIERKYSP